MTRRDDNHLSVAKLTGQTEKYLTFSLAREEYGIEITRVKEIIGMMPIITLPKTPDYIKGVINLRGKVIPIFDLRLKFEMQAISYSDRTCIIVVEIDSVKSMILTGIIVDSVSEVLNIPEHEIEEAPKFGTRLNTEYLLGMAKTGKNVKMLLNIDRVLSVENFKEIEKAS